MLDSKSQENIAKIVEEQFRTLISVTPGMNFNVIPVVGVQSLSSMASYFLLSRTTLGNAINYFRSYSVDPKVSDQSKLKIDHSYFIHSVIY